MTDDHARWVEQLAESSGRIVFNAAYRVLGNVEDAEDVLQTVFVKLLDMKTEPAGVRNWPGFLCVMATRCALDRLRSRTRHPQESPELLERMADPCSEKPDEVLDRHHMANLLRNAIRELPERDAQVFVLRYVEELSYEEIIEHAGIRTNQVGVILHRARKRLQRLLEPVLALGATTSHSDGGKEYRR